MTRPEPITFGSCIATARKKLPLSQKQLAEHILREEDGEPISPSTSTISSETAAVLRPIT